MGKTITIKNSTIVNNTSNKLTHARERNLVDSGDYKAIIAAYECHLDWKILALSLGILKKKYIFT